MKHYRNILNSSKFLHSHSNTVENLITAMKCIEDYVQSSVVIHYIEIANSISDRIVDDNGKAETHDGRLCRRA